MSLYLKLEDASSLMFSDAKTMVHSYETYLGWQAERVMSRGIARVWHKDDVLQAYVNHGRWLATCRACGSGMFTHPDWRLACCAECGAIYRGVEFPEQVAEITALLLDRPRRQSQNWEPGESLWRLRMENFLHRVAA